MITRKGAFIGLWLLYVATPSILSAATESSPSVKQTDCEWHKLPSQPFVMFIEAPGPLKKSDINYTFIYIKKKINYQTGMPTDVLSSSDNEDQRIVEFIKKLKGRIAVYHTGSRSLGYEISFPRPHKNTVINRYNVNGESWVGVGYPGFNISSTSDYIISSDFYTSSNEFTDYMVGLEKIQNAK